MNKAFCCEAFNRMVANNVVLAHGDLGFFIRGEPEFIDDGDDRMDDMTEEYVISHCPFCGTKITEVES